MSFDEVESNINYKFKDKILLERALTLASADNENNNERLEFLGDAILEFLVSEKIFGESKNEGKLTKRRAALVSDEALTPVSVKLGLDKHLIKGVGDSKNKKAVPSVYEAVIAAIYLDGGIDEARKFVLSTLNFSPAASAENYKGELQEYLQSRGEPCPKYISEDIGTPQKHIFSVTVTVFNKAFKGVAEVKQQAEMLAAKAAMEYIKGLED